MFGDNEQAVARGAERSAGDKGKDGLVGLVDECGDIGWLDNFAAGHLVGVACRFVVNID